MIRWHGQRGALRRVRDAQARREVSGDLLSAEAARPWLARGRPSGAGATSGDAIEASHS
jgi:hypothetical protein